MTAMRLSFATHDASVAVRGNLCPNVFSFKAEMHFNHDDHHMTACLLRFELQCDQGRKSVQR